MEWESTPPPPSDDEELRSAWVWVLSSLGGEFPVADSSDSAWQGFVQSSLVAPAWLILCGAVAVAIMLLVVLGRRGLVRLSGPQALGAFCLTVACFGASLYHASGIARHGFWAAVEELRLASQDFSTVRGLAESLGASSATMARNLDALRGRCPRYVQDYFGASLGQCKADLASYAGGLRGVSEAAARMPGAIQGIQEQGRHASATVAAWCLLLPAFAVAACCVAVGVAVTAAELSGHRCARRCAGCKLQYVSLGIAPAVMFVSAATAAELSLGIRSGALCANVDSVMMSSTETSFGVGSLELNMTRYYITGEGPNPALSSLQASRRRIDSCFSFFRDYQDDLVRMCPEWAPENLTVDLRIAWDGFAQCERLLAAGNINAYYRGAVHGIICGGALSSLGWLVVFQFLCGAVCLPLVTCMASWFLLGIKAQRENFRGFSLVSQDEEPDG